MKKTARGKATVRKTAGRATSGGRMASGWVYQLRISLRGIRPPVWRRVSVPGTLALSGLHAVIQTVFEWTDSHLHQFYVGSDTYGKPLDFDEEVMDEASSTLAAIVGTRVTRFTYVYDFGDDWVHDVVVEKVISGNSVSEGPVCLAGKRHRPPEDCGGVPGYQDFLRAIRDPGHEEHEAMLEWVGRNFDPEGFDLPFVNRALNGAVAWAAASAVRRPTFARDMTARASRPPMPDRTTLGGIPQVGGHAQSLRTGAG